MARTGGQDELSYRSVIDRLKQSHKMNQTKVSGQDDLSKTMEKDEIS